MRPCLRTFLSISVAIFRAGDWSALRTISTPVFWSSLCNYTF
jgi:hypothetical protein